MTSRSINTVLVLGAGASRSVKYHATGDCPSPLDSDFFDLLQRVRPHKADRMAVKFVLNRMKSLPHEYWLSMEKAFYTLHLRAYLSEKLGVSKGPGTDAQVVKNFFLCVQALLRKAHARRTCNHHRDLVRRLHGQDTILSFNYDMVVERALRQVADCRKVRFGRWLYGLRDPRGKTDLPVILKLHGSSNWRLENKRIIVAEKKWEDFDGYPRYRRRSGTGTEYPIFLPFWNKQIESRPWVDLWRKGLARLKAARDLVVWGYSLPPTDVKAQQLFRLALGERDIRLCVIDPSLETCKRWREMFPSAHYWRYNHIQQFRDDPPRWWERKPATTIV